MRSLFILLLLASCGANNQSINQSTIIKSSVINGSVVNSEDESDLYSAAVSMMSDTGKRCSGVLISSNLVLTAAHCVEKSRVGTISHVRLGRELIADNDIKTNQQEIAQIIVHPSYLSKTEPVKVDLALVVLKENVSEAFKPIEINNNFDFVKSGAPLKVAGFSPFSTAIIKDVFELMVNPITENYSLSNENDKISAMLTTNVIMLTEKAPSLKENYFMFNQAIGGICSGDSGGPAMIQVNNRQYLIGINLGVVSNIKNGKTNCEYVGFATSVRIYKKWILETIEGTQIAAPTFIDLKEKVSAQELACGQVVNSLLNAYEQVLSLPAETSCSDQSSLIASKIIPELEAKCESLCTSKGFENQCAFYKKGYEKMTSYHQEKCDSVESVNN